jgi:hypothetical protein
MLYHVESLGDVGSTIFHILVARKIQRVAVIFLLCKSFYVLSGIRE